MTSGSYPQQFLPGSRGAVGAMGADERLSRSVPRRLFYSFEKMSLPGAPLRNRTVDLLLTMSIPGRSSTAAILVRTGFVVVLVLVNVSGFRLVLARGWHGAGPSAWEQARHSMLTIMFAGREHSALSVSDPRVPPLILRAGTRRARSVWNDPSLVSYRHLVGYYRSPGTLAFCRLIPSTEVVGCCGQRWWSASRHDDGGTHEDYSLTGAQRSNSPGAVTHHLCPRKPGPLQPRFGLQRHK